FFTSRRRHTRFSRDWSSDVCSSDLGIRKHNHLLPDDKESLARSILDGDYLIGLIYRVAISRKEQKLLQKINPIYKRMQLQSLEGRGNEGFMTELKREIKDYLDQQSA